MMTSSFIPTTTVQTSRVSPPPPPFVFLNPPFKPNSFSLNPRRNTRNSLHFCCNAAKQQQSGPVKKRSQPPKTKNKGGFGSRNNEKPSGQNKGTGPVDEFDFEDDFGVDDFGIEDDLGVNDFEIEDDFEIVGNDAELPLPPKAKSKSKSKSKPKLEPSNKKTVSKSRGKSYQSMSLPKPPAGFVLDNHGKVVLVSDKRIVTIVDPSNNCPLECVIRRVFRSSRGDDCMLVCPVDMPVQIMKSTNFDGWSAVNEDEVEGLLPTASYTLARIHMHLVPSGFCFTARGGFCYTEDELFDIVTGDGQDDGVPTEGVELASFDQDGSHYMIYTPVDPLLFVAVKDQNGQLKIAEDDLLDDPAIASAVDEEAEFNAMVDEEEALRDSVWGKDIPAR